MTRQQQLPSSDNDALYARDPPSFPAFGQPIIPSRRMCPVAIVSLISGILTWIAIPIIGAVVAVISGHAARRRIRRSGGVMSGDGMAVVGLALGYGQLFIIFMLFGMSRMPPSIG